MLRDLTPPEDITNRLRSSFRCFGGTVENEGILVTGLDIVELGAAAVRGFGFHVWSVEPRFGDLILSSWSLPLRLLMIRAREALAASDAEVGFCRTCG